MKLEKKIHHAFGIIASSEICPNFVCVEYIHKYINDMLEFGH